MFGRYSIVARVMSSRPPPPIRRHQPQQQRARARVDAILDAAEALIAEQGHASLNLTAVAQHAQVPIGSVYQYFGGQPAVLRALAERYMARFGEQLQQLVDGAGAIGDSVLADVLDAYLNFYAGARVYQLVRAAAQGDAALRELDIADSHRNAERLAALLPRRASAAQRSALFLACEMTGSFASLLMDLRSQSAPAVEERRLRRQFLQMLRTLLPAHIA